MRSGTALVYDNVIDYAALGSMPWWAMHLRSYRAAGGQHHGELTNEDCANYSTNTQNRWVSGATLAKCCSTAFSTTVDGHLLQGEGYPCIGAPGIGVIGGTPEPVYFWNNRTFNGTSYQIDSTHVGNSDPSEMWAVAPNRDYCVSASQPSSCGGVPLSYSPYACPHPLTGYTGHCDPIKAGTDGYNVSTADTIPPAPPSGLSVN